MAAASDAGPPDLLVALEAPLCLEIGATSTAMLTIQNLGGSASSVVASVQLPAGTTFISAPGCISAGATQVQCDGGTLSTGARLDVPLSLTWPLTSGTRRLVATVASWSATTTGGTIVIPMAPPRIFDGSCTGTNLMSYAQCTPPSLLFGRLWPVADAGVENDGGVPGRWQQSTSQRNLCMKFDGPMGGTIFYGVSVSAGCFEGLIDNFEIPEPRVGAWRGCLQ